MSRLDSMLALIGRQRNPQLAQAQQWSPEDLTRMQLESLQGGDRERAGRIGEVMQRREQQLAPQQAPQEPRLEDALLSRGSKRQQLLHALKQKK